LTEYFATQAALNVDIQRIQAMSVITLTIKLQIAMNDTFVSKYESIITLTTKLQLAMNNTLVSKY